MYLKSNTIFRYRGAQIRSFQDECDGNRVVLAYIAGRGCIRCQPTASGVNIPVTPDASVHDWRLESGWGLASAVSSHQCRMA